MFIVLNLSVPIIQSLATLSAAFCGAWFAFLLHSRSKKAEETDKQVSVSNQAIFTLVQRVNNLRLYQREIIDPHRKDPFIFLAIQASKDFERDETLVDINSLIFLINYDKPQLLMDFYIEDQRYKTVLRLINLHTELHTTKVQPLLANAGFVEGKEYKIDYFKQVLGDRVFLSLERLVNDLINNLDATIESSLKLKDNFKEALKPIFHDKVFIDFQITNKNNH